VLRPQPLPPVPDDTARITQTAFRRGNPYGLLRDQPGAMFAVTAAMAKSLDGAMEAAAHAPMSKIYSSSYRSKCRLTRRKSISDLAA
jgi:hypothetical protein